MENNKYYEPEIEEFCVGFQYEVKIFNPDKSKPIEWGKIVWSEFSSYKNQMTVISDGKNIIDILAGDSFRVKFLDQEDIESLGWEIGCSSWDRDTKERLCVVSIPDYSPFYFEIVNNEQDVYQLTFDETLKSLKIVHATLSEESYGLMIAGKIVEKPKKIMTFNIKFDGTIKNISEIKKLMNQLNIK